MKCIVSPQFNKMTVKNHYTLKASKADIFAGDNIANASLTWHFRVKCQCVCHWQVLNCLDNHLCELFVPKRHVWRCYNPPDDTQQNDS
jgi:hypothetical protein